MEIGPIKVLKCSGTIENRLDAATVNLDLLVSLYLQREYANFNDGVWQMCVKNVSAIVKNIKNNHLYEISSNFVYGQFSQTERRQPIPLEKFLLRKDNEEVKLISFAPSTWFTINSPSAEFELFVRPCSELNNSIPKNGKITLTFTMLFRRVK